MTLNATSGNDAIIIFEVNGSNQGQIVVDGGDASMQFHVDEVNEMTIEDGGRIKMSNLHGTSAGGDVVEWDSSSKELYHETSDANLKENFQPMPYGLAEINQLNPCVYDMYGAQITNVDGVNTGFVKSDNPEVFKAIGMVAQEVGNIMPKLISGDVLKNYKNRELMTVMVKAIQELSAKVEALENA
jgi:hypothetical protein